MWKVVNNLSLNFIHQILFNTLYNFFHQTCEKKVMIYPVIKLFLTYSQLLLLLLYLYIILIQKPVNIFKREEVER